MKWDLKLDEDAEVGDAKTELFTQINAYFQNLKGEE